MSVTGAADGPGFRLGVAIADIVAGMFAAQGITARAVPRGTSGRGQYVDVGMLDRVAALLTSQAGICSPTGASPGRMGNRHPSIAPYDTFETARLRRSAPAVGNDEQGGRFCAVTGLDSLSWTTRASPPRRPRPQLPRARAVFLRTALARGHTRLTGRRA